MYTTQMSANMVRKASPSMLKVAIALHKFRHRTVTAKSRTLK